MDDKDPNIIAFKLFVHCEPVTNYIIETLSDIITYYCGNNNTFIIPYSYIQNILDKSK
jgi:hypothetical protein